MTVINEQAVIAEIKNNPGQAFEELKLNFMKLVCETALKEANGNKTKAARTLGMNRQCFYKWLEMK